MDTIPDAENYMKRILETKVFRKVDYVKHSDLLPRFTRSSLHLDFVMSSFYQKKMKNRIGYLLDENVYLFTDNSNIGVFLITNKKEYHLIEDGCNTFCNNQNLVHGRFRALKKIINKLFNIPYGMGMSKFCKDVEVNDSSCLNTQFSCPIIEVPRKALMEQLKKNEIEVLLYVFSLDVAGLFDNQKKLLLVTQPLVEMRVTETNEKEEDLYRKSIESYYPEYRIFIKPHPRDKASYQSFFNGDVTVLDRVVPIEILNYYSGIHFDLCVTYSSTSVNNMYFCDEIKWII